MSKLLSPSQALLSELAKPTVTYTRRAWMAMGALAVFILLYLALAGWFLLTAYRLSFGSSSSNNGAFWGWIIALCSALLAIFMLKGFFFVKRGGDSGALEITPAQQPRLFEFLYGLADEAGAPRPHRVFLSAHVNAAVFYDLSILNLFFPSKKNLEIGLGLVNVLNQGELKAVLAHEFGHFAQRAMAVGRWVYIAQQIAGNLVARRDAWDNFLNSWSQWDIRVAWVAWLLRIVVWSIRSLVDSAFGLVIMIQRALSREMEMQADLVAVSLTGSDALVHALHLLQAADDSWGRAASFAMDEKAAGRVTPDLFTLQTYLMEKMATLLNDQSYAKVPPLPTLNPEQHRVFKAELARPPKMWLTHPLNHEREENAKRRYVAAVIDQSMAWDMFDDATSLRAQVTAKFMEADASKVVDNQILLKSLDKQFNREHLKSHYRGVYYGRSPVRAVGNIADLYDNNRVFQLSDLDALYPESLSQDIEQLGQLEKELEQLRAIQAGHLRASGGRINLRGREIKRTELPLVIRSLEKKLKAVEGALNAHDKLCRSVHLAAAKQLQNGWPQYLQALLAVIHYADHSASNIRDAYGFLNNTIGVAMATRKVDESGVQRIIDAANSLYHLLEQAYQEADQVALDNIVRQRLEVTTWTEALGEFKLGTANRDNINQWLDVISGWVEHVANTFNALRMHALEQLLISESVVARNVRQAKAIIPAPTPPTVPSQYGVLLPGKERKRQTQLGWWARFQTADGMIPAVARFGVAGGIVAVVLGFGGVVGKSDMTVYNGLGRSIVVQVDEQSLSLTPYASTSVQVEPNKKIQIQARTSEGAVIESFEAEVKGSFAHFVYNVAAASPLIEWTNVYGNATQRPDRNLGAPRWGSTTADVLFGDPPKSISTKSGGGTREVLTGFGLESVAMQMSLLDDSRQRQHVIAMHARWDATNSRRVQDWLDAAQNDSGFERILAARLKEAPNDVVLLRTQQNVATTEQRQTLCMNLRQRAEAQAENADLHYLSDRCIDDESQKQAAFLRGHQQWPKHPWYGYAAAYIEAENMQWELALKDFDAALQGLPAMRSQIALEQMRISRLLQRDSAANMAKLAEGEPSLQTLLLIETNKPVESAELKAYQALYRGELEKAVSLVSNEKESKARILRLAAASTGASTSLQQKALALPVDAGIDHKTVWAAVGLALRTQRDYEAYLKVIEQMPAAMTASYREFILKLKVNDLAGAEQALNGLPPEYRAQAYTMGVIVLGRQAPTTWRDGAKRLLFSSERPYLG